jgi:hypothetical protein
MAILVVNQQYDIYSLTLIRNLNGQIFPLVIRKKTFLCLQAIFLMIDCYLEAKTYALLSKGITKY